jgi:4-amino-4-deoxychorismate lyase
MSFIFNGKLVLEEDTSFLQFQRAINYGDGLFETITGSGNEINHLPYHMERIQNGAATLHLELEDIFSLENISHYIFLLKDAKQINENFRVKIILWRRTGGLFTPAFNQADFIILLDPTTPPKSNIKKKAAICDSVRLHCTNFSKFKTLNSLPYVLAGLEKKKRNLDELIILDSRGYLSECTSSNLFWVKQNTFFTPALSTGCIEGIRRRVIIEQLKSDAVDVFEVEEKPEVLKDADEILSCNVSGIYKIQKILL